MSYLKYVFAGILLAILFKDYLYQGSHVSGSSMAPTLHDGDFVIVSKWQRDFERYDIVTIDANGNNIVKRIIAVEGDRVKIEDGELIVNDKKLTYSFHDTAFAQDYAEHVVEEGRFFALGDNVNNSTDSRSAYGTFRFSEIEGKVIYVWHWDEWRGVRY